MPRVCPVTGTDEDRKEAGYAGVFLAGEIHTTDQIRMFLRNRYLGPRYQGEVADEAAMLALNTSSIYGCFPADTCYRADTESEWVCQGGRGTSLAQWYNRASILDTESILSGGSFTSTPSDIVSGGSFLSRPSGRIFGGSFVTSTHGGMF